MKKCQPLIISIVFAILGIILVWVILFSGEEINSRKGEDLNKSNNSIGIANPASVYCQKEGGSLEIRKDENGGEYGVCIFENRKECEEWAFFRGECKKEEVKDNFCGRSTYGKCDSNSDCIVGGCSGQICQAKSEEPIVSTCEYTDCYNAETYNLECQCVEKKCQWNKNN